MGTQQESAFSSERHRGAAKVFLFEAPTSTLLSNFRHFVVWFADGQFPNPDVPSISIVSSDVSQHFQGNQKYSGFHNRDTNPRFAPQIIQDQSDVVNSLWQVLEATGLDHAQIIQVAAENGITIDNSSEPGQVPNIRPGVSRSQKDGPVPNRPKIRLDMLQIIPPDPFRASISGDNVAREAPPTVAPNGTSAQQSSTEGYLASYQSSLGSGGNGQNNGLHHSLSSSALGYSAGGRPGQDGGDPQSPRARSRSPLPSPRVSTPAGPMTHMLNAHTSLGSTYPGGSGRKESLLWLM